MSRRIIGSGEARVKWRDLLDAVSLSRDSIVIERHGKSVAVLISYEDYEALEDELDELRAARRAVAALEEWRHDSSLGRPWEEIEAELMAEGTLVHG